MKKVIQTLVVLAVAVSSMNVAFANVDADQAAAAKVFTSMQAPDQAIPEGMQTPPNQPKPISPDEVANSAGQCFYEYQWFCNYNGFCTWKYVYVCF